MGGLAAVRVAGAVVTPIKRVQDMTAEEIDAYQGDKVAHRFEEEADAPED